MIPLFTSILLLSLFSEKTEAKATPITLFKPNHKYLFTDILMASNKTTIPIIVHCEHLLNGREYQFQIFLNDAEST